MRSRKRPSWFGEFTPQQTALVNVIITSKTRMAFIIGLMLGFIVCTGMASTIALVLSDSYMKLSESEILHNAVEDRLSGYDTDLQKWRSSIQPRPEDYK